MIYYPYEIPEEDYEKFEAACGLPPRPSEKLKELMQTPAPWENEK